MMPKTPIRERVRKEVAKYNNREIIDTGDLAALLGVSRSTIRRYLHEFEGSYVFKSPRSVFFERTDFDPESMRKWGA